MTPDEDRSPGEGEVTLGEGVARPPEDPGDARQVDGSCRHGRLRSPDIRDGPDPPVLTVSPERLLSVSKEDFIQEKTTKN